MHCPYCFFQGVLVGFALSWVLSVIAAWILMRIGVLVGIEEMEAPNA